MANIRIDNLCGDALSVRLDGKEYSISEDESLTVADIKKGSHRLTVSKARRIGSNDDSRSADEIKRLPTDEESQYVLLSSTFEIDVSASKSVWTIRRKPMLVEKAGVDALFSGCDVEVGGGKIAASSHSFASSAEKTAFLKKQIKNAVFPIGIGIIIFTILVAAALIANISGSPITLGGRKFTYPWTFGLAGIDLVFIGYFSIMLKNIFSTSKKYNL